MIGRRKFERLVVVESPPALVAVEREVLQFNLAFRTFADHINLRGLNLDGATILGVHGVVASPS